MFRDFHRLVLEDRTAEPIAAALARSNHEATLPPSSCSSPT
jgi:hypothetical protein